MKKILLLFLLIGSLAFAKAKINDDTLILELKNGIIVKMNETKSGELRVKVLENNKVIIPENEFFINKEASGLKIKEKDLYFEVGNYYVKELENSYSVYGKDYSLYYTSEFQNTNGGIKEFKRCWNEEAFHGMGEAAYNSSISSFNFKIHQVSDFGDQAQLHIPFYFTNKGDAFYYNAHHNDTFKFGRKEKGEVTYIPEKQYMDYYFYHKADLKDLVSHFYDFSESKSLLPKWAFGYIQSKYGYKTEKEVYDLVEEFQKREIPLSAIVLDLQWFKKMGDLDWDKNAWPNPEKMDKYLENNGIKLITISEPFFTNNSKNYDEFYKEGLFAKRENGDVLTWGDWWCFGADFGAIVNPIAPKAKEILGAKYVEMKKTGIDAYWTDLGEPESTPSEAMFNQYSENEFHNYYNREWSKLVYEAHNEAFPDERLMILSRSGYTGSGKYNLSVWSGDSESSFKILKKQIGIGLNGGVTGFSYWGSDVGGFMSGERLPSKELFIRWMQFGAFTPVFRAHGAMTPREPWIHDDEATEIISKYIKLRYEMSPYIYSTAYETYEDGVPMMRGLYLENSGDKESSSIKDEFYFGEYVLVAPVLEKLKKKSTKTIYLPAGDWYDFYTYKKYEAGEHEINLSLDKIPLFIEEGAILPFESYLNLFPKKDGNSKFELYNDDGLSNNYLKGDFEKLEITLNNKFLEMNNVKESRKLKVKLFKENVFLSELKNYTEDEKFYIFEIDLLKGNNKFNF